MLKTASLNTRIEPRLKEQVGAVLNNLGMSYSDAINIYFRQIVLEKAIPFEIKSPKFENIISLKSILNENYLNNKDKIDKFPSNIEDILMDELIEIRKSTKRQYA